MNCTVDASVFASAVRHEEEHWLCSREFLRRVQVDGAEVFCPTLVVPECAAAVARATGDAAHATRIVALIESLPRIHLVALDLEMAHEAASLAVSCRVRGADSIYMATARASLAVLVTWDKDVLLRADGAVRCVTPQQWLDGLGPDG